MDKYKNEARLIGVDYASNISEIPNTLADVADYIVANGIYGFLEIYADSSNDIVLTTSSLESDFCPDREYLNALLPCFLKSCVKQNKRNLRSHRSQLPRQIMRRN